MNSKTLFIFTLFSLFSCGVKAPPVKFKDQAIDSYLESYTGNSSSINSKSDEPNQDSTNSKTNK